MAAGATLGRPPGSGRSLSPTGAVEAAAGMAVGTLQAKPFVKAAFGCPGLELAQGHQDVNFTRFSGCCICRKGFGRPGRAGAALPAAADFPHHPGAEGAVGRQADACTFPRMCCCLRVSVSHSLVLA